MQDARVQLFNYKCTKRSVCGTGECEILKTRLKNVGYKNIYVYKKYQLGV